MSLHPYLNFGGNAREAFTTYQQILGGQLDILGMGDIPDADETPEGMDGMVMHAALMMDDGGLLMGSDAPLGEWDGITGAYVNYTLPDAGEAKRVFDALAEGGEVEMALGETFWSPGFGICVDRFGARWMVNVEPTDAPATA